MRSGDMRRRLYEVGTSAASYYTDEERVFLMAMDTYKRRHQRPFPTWDEVLAVLLSLGYRRVAEPGPLPCPRQIGRLADPERRP